VSPRSLAALAALAFAAATHGAEPSGARVSRDRFVEEIRSIQAALENREFEKLERLHDALVASRARTSDGTWMTESFEWAFDESFRNDTPARLDRLLADWRRAAPSSILRPIAEAFVWQNRAWRARGSGCSPGWIAGAEEVYARHLQRAASALEGAAQAKASPLWYTVAIRVAGGERRTASAIEALLEEGESRHPAYRPLYLARLTFLLPAWGGDFGQVDRFARWAAERTRASEAGSFYAGLHVDLARVECGDQLGQSRVSWPDMKQGLLDMIERHDASWNWNLLGTFACRFRDWEETARVLAKLGKEANLGIWSRGISTRSCREMVRPEPLPARMSFLPRRAGDGRPAGVLAG
jgi:hypothetical protein